mmetsp:Transcript_12349/g.31170  ORF Transcript_12349/g.31170 Transcript_12349/m.31170 type:complete len:266 (+) Transcript_12349:186-983(+)
MSSSSSRSSSSHSPVIFTKTSSSVVNDTEKFTTPSSFPRRVSISASSASDSTAAVLGTAYSSTASPVGDASADTSFVPGTCAATASVNAGSPAPTRATSLYPAPNLFFRRSDVPMTRSLPDAMMPTRSPRISASSIECVTSTMTRSCLAAWIMSHTSRRDTGSIPVVGSSKKTIDGSPVSATATDSLRCIPPEYVPACLSATPCRETCSRRRVTSAARSAFGIPFSAANSSMCSADVSSFHSTSCCGHTPRIFRSSVCWCAIENP